MSVDDMKPKSLSELLVMTRGNMSAAERFTGISRMTLTKMVQRKVPTAIAYVDGNPVLLAPIRKSGRKKAEK